MLGYALDSAMKDPPILGLMLTQLINLNCTIFTKQIQDTEIGMDSSVCQKACFKGSVQYIFDELGHQGKIKPETSLP